MVENTENWDETPKIPDTGASAEPAQTKRSSIPFGIGLTLIIGGALLTLWGIVGGAFALFAGSISSMFDTLGELAASGTPQGEAFSSIWKDMMAIMKTAQVVQGIQHIILGLISILALVAGIGLVKYRRWGRKAALAWSCVAGVYLIADMVVTFTVILPATKKMMTAISEHMNNLSGEASMNAPMGMMEQMSSSFSMAGSILGTVLLAVTPILAAVMLTQQSARDALN